MSRCQQETSACIPGGQRDGEGQDRSGSPADGIPCSQWGIGLGRADMFGDLSFQAASPGAVSEQVEQLRLELREGG